MTEDQYDDEIAPALREVMNKVHDLGGTIIAFCEFDANDRPRGWGLTADVPKHSAHSMFEKLTRAF